MLDCTWCQIARSKHHQTSCCESIESFRASPLAVMSFIQASETPPSVTPSVELRSLPATVISGCTSRFRTQSNIAARAAGRRRGSRITHGSSQWYGRG